MELAHSERYRDLDHNQCHHKARRATGLTPLSRWYKSQGHEDKTSLADELASHAEAKSVSETAMLLASPQAFPWTRSCRNIHHGEETRN